MAPEDTSPDPDEEVDVPTESSSVPERHCTKCGTQAADDDLFCRSCGAGLPGPVRPDSEAPDEDPAEHEVTEERPVESSSPATKQGRRRWPVVAAVGVLVLAAVAVGLVVGGVFDSDPAPTAAEKRAVVVVQLKRPFDQAMRQRATLLVAERDYLAATRDARRIMRRYQKQADQVIASNKRVEEANQPLYDACSNGNVACPNPTYATAPSVPDVGDQVDKLRATARMLGELNAQVLAVQPKPALRTFYAQLESGTQSLEQDATYNGDTLSKAVTPGKPGEGDSNQGDVDASQLKTLHGETALPAIQQLNRQALNVIRQLGLSIPAYDVPGGTDVDPADHSTAR